MLYFEVKGG